MNEYMYELYIAFNLTAIFLGMISIAGLIKVRDIGPGCFIPLSSAS